jgi:hypothetical protein
VVDELDRVVEELVSSCLGAAALRVGGTSSSGERYSLPVACDGSRQMRELVSFAPL